MYTDSGLTVPLLESTAATPTAGSQRVSSSAPKSPTSADREAPQQWQQQGAAVNMATWADQGRGQPPWVQAAAADADASRDHGPPGPSPQPSGFLQRVLASRLGMQGQGPLQRYSGRYLTMTPEELEAYCPHSNAGSAEVVPGDVSCGKTAVASSGFHQLLVMRQGDEHTLSQHKAAQEEHLLAESGDTEHTGADPLKQQQQQHEWEHLQQQGSQHIDIPHQHAPAAADIIYTSGGLAGATSLPSGTTPAVVVEEDGVGHCGTTPGPQRSTSVFGLPTIPPNSSLHAAWLLLMLFVDLTYTAFVNPVLIVVGWIDPFNEAWILEAIFGGPFVVDLLLGFHVQYAVRCRFTRRLMTDGRSIARYYMRRGLFPLALLSTIPWVLLLAVQLPWALSKGRAPLILTIVLQLMTGVRILRLWRVLRMVSGFYRGAYLAGYSASQPFTVGALYFASITFSGAVYINLLACLWFLTARLQGFSNSWLQSVNDEDLSDPDLSSVRQFLAAVYLVVMTITTVGYGDVPPTSDGERMLAILTMLAGSVFLSFLVSVLVDTMAALNQKGQHIQRYRERLQAVDAWMQEMELPQRLADSVYAYYNSTWLQQQEDQELWTRCLQDLPLALRAEVSYALLQPVLADMEVFRGLTPDQLKQVVVHMRAQRLAPGGLLCLQGDEMSGIWVLQAGQLDLVQDGRWRYTISAPEVVGMGAVLTLLGASATQVDAAVRHNLHQQPKASNQGGSSTSSTEADIEGATDQAAKQLVRLPQEAEEEPGNPEAVAAGRWQVPEGQHRFRPYTLRCRGSVSAWHLPMAALESLVVRFPLLQERLLKLWEERWASGLERGPDV